jgi:hypothetical protein
MASTALLTATPSWAADDTDLGALDLKSAPVDAEQAAPQPTKLFIEAGLGNATQRYSDGSQGLRRVSVDIRHASKLAPGWRFVLSDRIDHVHPSDAGMPDTLNSLREAYVSWDGVEAGTVVDIGRINLRYGPGYGYNPTDFFRDGAVRSVTSVNPFELRENRLGTVALRAQRLWQGGSMAIALSPKLADEPSTRALNADLGATNNRNRLLLTASQQLSERVSGQVLLYKEPGLDAQPGASVTALVSDAAVAHAEWSYARGPSLAAQAWATPAGTQRSGHKLSTGLTYTTASKLSITGEYQFNGMALDQASWGRTSAGNPGALPAYLIEAQRLQELASRRAYLVYLSQRDFGMKGMELTGFMRVNANDHSRLAWAELRYHWSQVDLALQWQQHSGRAFSEYGLYPDKRIVQVVASYHFK